MRHEDICSFELASVGYMDLLTYMGSQGHRNSYNARDLAKATSLPLAMVGKILKAFTRGGVLTSQRGAKGGYALARSPEAEEAVRLATEAPLPS